MILKYFVLPLFTLFSIAHAEAPTLYTPLPDVNIIIVQNALVTVNSPLPEPILSQIRLYKGWDAETMIAIATCESGLNQNAVSKTGDYGIFQVNEFWWDSTAQKLGLDYKNSVEDNIEMAKVIHKQGGYKMWVCAKILGISS